MASPYWIKTLINKTFSGRFFFSKLTHYPVLGRIIDYALFDGDDILYLPKDKAIPVNASVDKPESLMVPSLVVDHSRAGNSGIAVIAVHGGGIEPGTVDIADLVAGAEHTFYAFKGIKKKGNAVLHISSNKFDEPEGTAIAEKAEIVVSIHGCHGKDERVFVGGRNQNLKRKICYDLNKAGFSSEESAKEGLHGRHPENICNRCLSGEGVQLEITRGLREKLFDNIERRPLRKRSKLFFWFVETLRESLR